MCLSCIKWLDESLKTEKKVNGFIRRALKSTSELQFLVSSNGKTIRTLYTEKRGGNVDSSSSHHPILSSLSPSSTRYHTASASVLNENILQLARILQSLITTKLDLINSLLKLASCSPSFANGFSSELKEKCDYVFGDEDGISYESSLLEMYSQFEMLSLTAPDLNNTFSTNTEDCHYDDNNSKIAALKLKFNDYACVSFDFFSFTLPNTFLALLRFIMLNDDHGLPSNIIVGNDIYHKSEEDGYNDAGYCLEMYFRAVCTYGSSVAQIYRAGTNEYFSTREKNTALTASNGKTNNKDTETSNTTDNYASENYRRVAISQMYSILTTLYAKVNVLSDLVAAKNNHSSEKSSELSSHDSNLEFLSLYKSLGEEIDILSTLHARNQKILEGKYNENNTLSGVYGYGIDGVCGTTSNVNTNSNTTESGSIDPDSLGQSQLDGTENSKYFVDASSSYFTDLLAPLEIYELEEANEKSNEANSEHTQTSLDQNPLFVRSGLSRAERIALAKQKRENQRQRKQRQETCQQNPGHDTAKDQLDQFEPFMFINELKSAILDKTKPY
ncbi:hypothetical protein AX774_g3233 [Zancudomyces culisetae]|uniref:Uncharacterized protein n=1 Tax=Zancudomyces culisetae TaxID=1213189 RepID=A0A1R1PQS8_ZANCU|nr:hypothetical protein AX774_g3233 [Zancudomyces culisetae]|eukprot:OMH83263.1 hypothetical protein AX774_g3233 [Zancudomyces culisetae]